MSGIRPPDDRLISDLGRPTDASPEKLRGRKPSAASSKAAPAAAAKAATPKQSTPRVKAVTADRLLRAGLNLRQLQLLVALDDHRKLHQAATSQNLSQPAASKMLSKIEDLVGVTLFDRLPRGIEPTLYGEALIRRSRTVLAELGRAGEEISALRDGDGGVVSIGTVMAPAVNTLLDALESVRDRTARSQITVHVDTSDVLAERLLSSKLDFSISRIPAGMDPSPFDYQEAGLEEALLLVRRSHPLALLDVVTPMDLRGRSWVMQPRGSLLRRSVEAMLRRYDIPAPEQVLNTPSILMSMVSAARTDTIAPLGAPVADLFCATGYFVRLPLTEKVMVEPYGLIKLHNRVLSPAAQVLYDAVRLQLFGTL